MTTLYSILATAKEVLQEYGPERGNTRIERMAEYIVDQLGPLLECGYESPVVNYNYDPPRIDIPEYIGVPLEDVKGIINTVLSAVDEASDK